jgi:hypothetical protein
MVEMRVLVITQGLYKDLLGWHNRYASLTIPARPGKHVSQSESMGSHEWYARDGHRVI